MRFCCSKSNTRVRSFTHSSFKSWKRGQMGWESDHRWGSNAWRKWIGSFLVISDLPSEVQNTANMLLSAIYHIFSGNDLIVSHFWVWMTLEIRLSHSHNYNTHNATAASDVTMATFPVEFHSSTMMFYVGSALFNLTIWDMRPLTISRVKQTHLLREESLDHLVGHLDRKKAKRRRELEVEILRGPWGPDRLNLRAWAANKVTRRIAAFNTDVIRHQY